MKLQTAYASHRGRVREINQDAVAVFRAQKGLFGRKPRLMILADGMGGHLGGEVASRMAIRTVKHVFYREFKRSGIAPALEKAIQAANDAIRDRSEKDESLHGMGTTVVAGVIRPEHVVIASVGDSRAYLMRGEAIRQVTQDHSAAAEQARRGEPALSIGRNVLSRAVGRRDSLEVDVFTEPWEPGDTLLMCSDGLWGQVSDAQIAAVVAEMPPREAVPKLVQMAMIAQAPDNISVIVVRRKE